MVSEEGYEEEWNEGDELNDSYDGYWADVQNENEGYCAYEDLCYIDEYGYFQGKGKRGKKGKADEGKGGEPGDGKGKSNDVQPQTSSTPAIQNQQPQQQTTTTTSSLLFSSIMLGFFAETDPARVDVFDSHLSRARAQETHSSRRTKPT